MGPILGALLVGGSLLGAGVMARRNRLANAAIDRKAAENARLVDDFAAAHGDAFDEEVARATAGAELYADALGLSGPEGRARANSAFTAGPGYDFALGEAERAILRGAAAAGMTASGNTMDALQRNAIGRAHEAYDAWLGRLAPFLGAESAGLENKVSLGNLIRSARTEGNAAAIDRTARQIENRQRMIGSLLGFAGDVAGRAEFGAARTPAPAYGKFGGL